MSDRYFQLQDHVGLTVDGNLEPLVEIGLVASVPRMKGGEVIESHDRYSVTPRDTLPDGEPARIIPGTRMVHARSAQVADVLLQTGHYEEIDAPTKQEISAAKKAVGDAKDEAGTHEPDPLTNPEQWAEGQANDKPKGA